MVTFSWPYVAASLDAGAVALGIGSAPDERLRVRGRDRPGEEPRPGRARLPRHRD